MATIIPLERGYELMKLISFVIPCYRSEHTIKNVIDEIIETVARRQDYDYEIVCVNDCSPDSVYSVLQEQANKNKKIKVINLAKNSGKHAAVLAGFSFAEGDYIVNLDDDFQSPVPELWKLIEPLEKDACDAAMAKYKEKKEAVWKKAGSKFNFLVGSILLDRPDGFRFDNFWVVKKFVAKEMIKYVNSYPFLEGLLLRTTHRIVMIPMEERNRGDENTTGYTFKKSIALFANGFTAFSIKPLRISMFVGTLTAFVGIVAAIVILIQKLLGQIKVLGFATSTILQLIIGGLILMSLGMIGEYVGRIYISINNAPQYIIRDTINIE